MTFPDPQDAPCANLALLVYNALVFALHGNFEERDRQLQNHSEGCSIQACEKQDFLFSLVFVPNNVGECTGKTRI